MNVQEWAQLLNNRQYRNEITPDEATEAADDDVVIVFGASDDLCELRGAIDDEFGVDEDDTIPLTESGFLQACEDEDCPYYANARSRCVLLRSLWVPETGVCWRYEIPIPHETFLVLEGNEPYCRGIVFAMDDLRKMLP